MTNAIKINQRLPRGLSKLSTHFKPSQNRTDIINMAAAYTSASTAENQNESEKANANEPTMALPKTTICSATDRLVFRKIYFTKTCTIVQNKNKTVSALKIADIILTI